MSQDQQEPRRPTFSAFDGKTDKERITAIENYVDLDKFDGLSPKDRIALAEQTNTKLMKFYGERGTLFCGFQANLTENYSQRLSSLLDIHLNNIGDPYADVGGFRLNSKAAERAILKYYSELWVGHETNDTKIAQPCGIRHLSYQPDSMDDKFFASAIGYVCSFGSTEGNTFSLRQARDFLKGKYLFNKLYGDLSCPSAEPKDVFGPLSKEQCQPQPRAFGSHQDSTVAVHFKREDRYHPSAALVPTAITEGDRTSFTNVSGSGLLSPLMSPRVSAIGIEGLLMSPNLEGMMSPPQPVPRSLLPATSAIGLKPFLPKEINGVKIEFNGSAFRQPIILYSDASHYSISKIKDLLEVHSPATFMNSFYNNNWQRPDVVIKPSDCFAVLQKRYTKKINPKTATPPSPLNLQLGVDQPVEYAFDVDLTPENYIKIFGKDEFPHTLPIYEDGTMNLEALRFMTRFFFSLGNPIIVVANIGTTFSGCHDDPQAMSEIIVHTPGCHVESSEKMIIDGVGYTKISRRNYYIHADGALGASYVPFWELHRKAETEGQLEALFKNHAQDENVQFYLYRMKQQSDILKEIANGSYKHNPIKSNPCRHNLKEGPIPPTTVAVALESQQIPYQDIVLPTFTFRECPGVMSVAMSGHKFIGGPAPSGVVMTLRKFQLDFLTSGITYISSPDTTISGSRSGLNVAVMYDYLSRHGPEMEIAKYWSVFNSARFCSKLMAHSIKSTFLSVARDKPRQFWIPKLDKFLYEEQEKQYQPKLIDGKLQAPLKAPLVFNFTGALSVIFPQPRYDVQDKFSLSLDVVHLPRSQGYNFCPEYLETSPILSYNSTTETYTMRAAHMFTMDSVTTAVIEELCADLGQDLQIQALVAAQIPPDNNTHLTPQQSPVITKQ